MTEIPGNPTLLPAEASPSRGRVADTLRRHPSLIFGGVLAGLFVLVGIVGLVLLATPALHPLYLQQNLNTSLTPPGSSGYPLGSDQLGRDVLWRIVAGTGVSLGIAAVVTILSITVGGLVGIVAGFYRGKADVVLSGIVDITWGFPIILLAIILAGVFAPGLTPVVLGIALINWAGFARIIRGEVLSLRERDFIRAGRAIGMSNRSIIRRHVIPNLVPATLVMASYYVAITIIAEAGLSFIGVGIQPPTPSLGQMIADGQNYWSNARWLVIEPGLALVLIVLGLNALGDGLRDLLDPRLRTRE
ncbi:ABC-type dipeptide/oligopeptide/nickel transport system permease component [Gaiella occulta]|uniref:ABC-type dipeptide/oligopeptide/nickel transport system permease component n=1 Tax=Gaiella occulta TaxID=1002870 RepID=A0A7M2YTZ8_9ACTN|nr:ABC transporter permease [Gaiella occulta]RDI73621.1 ABC-type dipeptide/oligopeptide/nickel transport system permease component [Gaiella occulta]